MKHGSSSSPVTWGSVTLHAWDSQWNLTILQQHKYAAVQELGGRIGMKLSLPGLVLQATLPWHGISHSAEIPMAKIRLT